MEAVTAPATTFTLALDCPAGIAILAGSGNADAPPERATVAPLAGAAAVSDTVIATVAPGATLDGEAVTELSAAGTDLIRDQSVTSE